MNTIKRPRATFPRAAARLHPHFEVLRKAVSFALIGVVNVMIDGGVFFLAYTYLSGSEPVLRQFDAFAGYCRSSVVESIPPIATNMFSWLITVCGVDTLTMVVANIPSWLVAVSCSYVMNSHFTFAVESGRQLRWKNYGTFVAAGILGLIVNTATLVIAAKLLPMLGGEGKLRVMVAKGCAILAGFVVNFSMSHFVVFRRRPTPAPAGDSARP
jgi:putative flippase GtrA